MDAIPLEALSRGTMESLKKQHDFSNALRTVRLVLEELEAGYRFDDADAEENLCAFRNAVVCLERTSPVAQPNESRRSER